MILDIIYLGATGSEELSTLLVIEPIKYAALELDLHATIGTSPTSFMKDGQNRNNSIAITVPEAVPTAKNITRAFDSFYALILLNYSQGLYIEQCIYRNTHSTGFGNTVAVCL